ncbi:MAG TPA: neprosin family prolyl endopeptidase [Kribbella sp.]|jgi:hypothetical protein
MAHRFSPRPFASFLESVTYATYDEFRSLPGSEVESATAFAEMRTYLLDLYKGVTVDTSYIENDGQVIDCIPEDQHPAVRRSNGNVIAAPPAAPPAPESYETTPPPFLSPTTTEISGALPRSQYQNGTETRPQDPPGTLPMYRTTLEQLSRFKNFAAFSAKGRLGGIDASLAEDPPPKRYATGEQDVGCLGGSSHLNVWKPFAGAQQWAFSQQWHIAIREGVWMQTVECGWHIDLARYQDAEPHLFVFTTLRNYNDGQNFYNLDGGLFRPTQNPYVTPGTTRLLFSQTDGTQVAYKMGFYLTAGAWWFYFDDHPVGCYPLAVFGNGPLTQGATRIRFGGEVESRIPFWPPMGSGSHASAGYGKAAYQRDALVYPAGGGAVSANLSEAGSTTGSCYTVGITNNSASDWGTYLYFGGPGGQPC